MKPTWSTILRRRKFRGFMASLSYYERRYMMLHGRPKAINPKADVAALIRVQNRIWLGEITNIHTFIKERKT